VTGALEAFAAEVGAEGPVSVVGGRTQWDVGGSLAPDARHVTAPIGVVAHEPGEMIVRVGAGTTLSDLQSAVAAAGQSVWLEAAHPQVATVGGVLAVGHSGLRRLGRGPVRDTVLEVTAVDAGGRLIRSGAPLVKNVTGFDLCRLLVGSLGTLAFLAQVVLRCRPAPEVEAWWISKDADPFDVASRLYRPLSVLWDGATTWVGLAGYRTDVEAQATTVLGPRFRAVDGPPSPPTGGRRSVPPREIRSLPTLLGPNTAWLAEVGVGVVHLDPPGAMPPPADPDPRLVALHQSLKARFDPSNRLNPGREALR
jgi:glycolate dehydrogenase FAD-binding subunit